MYTYIYCHTYEVHAKALTDPFKVLTSCRYTDYEKEREERGVLSASFKASTLHDDSWDDEHLHLHPDRYPCIHVYICSVCVYSSVCVPVCVCGRYPCIPYGRVQYWKRMLV